MEATVNNKAQYTLHSSDSRGLANHGWLLSRHTFSFANYYDPNRVQFGSLRVLNDDIVKPGMGFGTHPHNNMEIISIPLSGSLEHKDSTGQTKAIHTGDVQIMSAGSGIHHSEYNHSKDEEVNFLQIWVFPKEKNIQPQYGQKNFEIEKHTNELITVVSPNDDNALWINQDAWFSMGAFDKDHHQTYQLKKPGNGVYLFLIDGEAEVDGQKLNKRDGLGITNADSFEIDFKKDSKILIMDIPMNY